MTLAFDLPAGLRFDGTMDCGDAGVLAQFTETDSTRESYGCSFYLSSGADLDAVLARREEKRLQFAGASR